MKVLLVLSGKGGVGKSTVSSCIATSLSSSHKVGILDIDLTGPSIPKVFDASSHKVKQGSSGWLPVKVSNNLSCMSLAFLVDDADAVIWRAIIKQFLTNVEWGDIEYLIIDTPPGTGDEHISMAEFLKDFDVMGAVIVTTPQIVAKSDAIKGISFCEKVGIRVLGAIENMSGYICTTCGECNEIFAKSPNESIGTTPLLAKIPIDPILMRAMQEPDFITVFPTCAAASFMNSAHRELLPQAPLLARPARKQTSEFGGNIHRPNGSIVFNIWYSKWEAGDRERNSALYKAEARCNISTDMGYTRAKSSASFCIHFARGCCARGSECNFWHRIPLPTDNIPMAQDVFGRERHRDEREDMSGVGSFEKDNRTLHITQFGVGLGIEDVLFKHFMEWGEVEFVRLLPGRGVAYVCFKNRINAEFAKEAMYRQSLDEDEVGRRVNAKFPLFPFILRIVWAKTDPNPKVIQELKKRAEANASQALKQSLPVVGEMGTILDYQEHYSTPVEQISDDRRIMNEHGWDTPDGFFYKSNEAAALALSGSSDQVQEEYVQVPEVTAVDPKPENAFKKQRVEAPRPVDVPGPKNTGILSEETINYLTRIRQSKRVAPAAGSTLVDYESE